jgi:carboxylesterase
VGLAAAGLAAAAGAAAALAVARARAARGVEARLAARLPLGPDGVVRGAGALALDAPPAAPAALLLHGFGDTPQSLAELARHLHAAGWTVRAPLLPGHGRTARAFAAVRAADWLHAARDAYHALRADAGGPVALVGQSMGAALAAVLAAESAGDGEPVPALVLLAPYLAAPASVRWAARLAPLMALGVHYLSSDGGARSIHDAEARAQALGSASSPRTSCASSPAWSTSRGGRCRASRRPRWPCCRARTIAWPPRTAPQPSPAWVGARPPPRPSGSCGSRRRAT